MSLGKNRFKQVEISIKTFCYSEKFDVREKKRKISMGFTELLIFCRGWTWKKFWHTVMVDCATDWEVIIVAKSCVYRENVLNEKLFSFVPKVWLGKVHEENEGHFRRRYLQACILSEWGWMGIFRCFEEGKVLHILPDSKDLRDFARLRAAFNRGFELRTSGRV